MILYRKAQPDGKILERRVKRSQRLDDTGFIKRTQGWNDDGDIYSETWSPDTQSIYNPEGEGSGDIPLAKPIKTPTYPGGGFRMRRSGPFASIGKNKYRKSFFFDKWFGNQPFTSREANRKGFKKGILDNVPYGKLSRRGRREFDAAEEERAAEARAVAKAEYEMKINANQGFI